MHRGNPSSTGNHDPLVEGMENLYRLLIALDYLQASNVHFHSDGSESMPVATEQLRAAGLGDEAISLVQRLPYLDNGVLERWSHSEIGIPLAPGSQAVSYTVGHVPDVQDMRTVRNGQIELGTNDFKIARAGPREGNDIVYRFGDSTKIPCRRFVVAELIFTRDHRDYTGDVR